jgi:hypothetical protein
MKIEKLKGQSIMFEKHNFHSENHANLILELTYKINELIDAFNIIEEDRSIQIKRMSDRLCKIEDNHRVKDSKILERDSKLREILLKMADLYPLYESQESKKKFYCAWGNLDSLLEKNT